MSLEEQLLTQRLLNEGELAFQEIFNKEHSRLLNLAYGMLSDTEAAKDVIQDSFLKLWRHRQKIDKERGYSKWLSRCVVNATLDILRQKKRKIHSISELSAQGDFEMQIEAEENDFHIKENEEFIKATVDKALKQLDEKYRVVVILRIWEKMPYKEIAELLQIPTGTAGRRFSVGLDKLEQLLENIYQKE